MKWTAFLCFWLITGCGCGESNDSGASGGTASGGSAGSTGGSGASGGSTSGGAGGATGGSAGGGGASGTAGGGGTSGSDAGDGPIDTTPPTISLGASKNLVTQAESILLTATASDDVGVVDVVFYEGTTVLGTDATTAYEQSVAYTYANNGTHTYKAVARDQAGNTAEATVEVGVAIDATNSVWKKQFNGTPTSTDFARMVTLDAQGRPIVLTHTSQGVEDAFRWAANGNFDSHMYGTGTTTPNIYMFGVATNAAGDIGISGAWDGCSCSDMVHTLLLITKDAPNLNWNKTLGLSQSSNKEFGYATTVAPNGDIYVCGSTLGTMSGQGPAPFSNAGKTDAFLFKVSQGALVWARQWGTASDELCTKLTLDSQGRIWSAGYIETGAALAGQTSAGARDAWLKVFDADGNALFTTQFGTTLDDAPGGVAALASGAVVVAGSGGPLPGAVTSTGDTLGTTDGWLRYYDATFQVTKTLMLGTPGSDAANGVAANAKGDVWVVGRTAGSLGTSAGAFDAYARRYGAGDAPIYTRQFGTAGDETLASCAVDAAGNLFAVGSTSGSLFASLEGATDGILVSLGPLGNWR